MSDTPRTDAHTRQLIDILQHPHWIEFARTLEREAVSLRDDLDALQHTLRGMEVQEERLKLENAALRADKERLDWLQQHGHFGYVIGTKTADCWTVDLPLGEKTTLRAAIDAARKEAKL